MKQRVLVIGLALGLLTVAVPASMASHFAVGADTYTGGGPAESPVGGDFGPSVKGTTENTSDTPYGVATTPSDFCQYSEAEGNVTNEEGGLSDEPERAHTQDGLCNRLVYQEGNPSHERAAPHDQDYRDPTFLDTFDVQRTYSGFIWTFTFCEPFCEENENMDALWNVTHDTGEAVGLTEDSNDADKNNEGDRGRFISLRPEFAYPASFVQDNTEIWRMNGYTAPAAQAGFIGFLEDENGPIDDNELRQHVNSLRDSSLPSDVIDSICGYVPQASFVSTGAQTECDTPMHFVGNNDSAEPNGDAVFSSYNDPCDSPAYTCAPTGEHWRSDSVGLIGAYSDSNGDDHFVWHWVVAPTSPDCGAVAPGFVFEEDTASGVMPYLAYDLDIYTPPNDLNESEVPHVSIDGHHDYRNALVDDATSLDLPPLPGVVGNVSENASDALDDTTRSFVKQDLMEPNHVDTAGDAFDDNSRQLISVDRGSLDDCAKLTDSETDETRDAWKNYIDSGVSRNREIGVQSSILGSESAPTLGTYGNDEEGHDDENDPTTDTYSTDGFVGVFADKNDDGDYDQRLGNDDSIDMFGQSIYKANDIQATGAYPMVWDMHVNFTDNGQPQVAQKDGCTLQDPISTDMFDAGYGPNTTLVQAIYLSEATAFSDLDAEDPRVIDYENGNNIYVLGSNATRVLWDGTIDDGADTHDLSEEVDGFVEDFADYLSTEHGVTDPGIEEPGERLNRASDFDEQCGESTGGYDSALTFTHTCETGCAGDTIATMYTYEVRDGAPLQDANGNPTIGGGDIPALVVDGENVGFSDDTVGTTQWIDIDPFDGDETRNEERMERPPTGE